MSKRNLTIRWDIHRDLESCLAEESTYSKNGKKTPVSNVATFETRSKGGKTSGNNNVESGHWAQLQQEHSSKNGKKNIIFTQTLEAKQKQREAASYIIRQLTKDGIFIKDWIGKSSFNDCEFNYGSIVHHIKMRSIYKGYRWEYIKKSNKNHRKSHWNINTIMELALTCSYKAQFKQKSQVAYIKAKQLDIFDKVTSHMKRPKAKNQYTK